MFPRNPSTIHYSLSAIIVIHVRWPLRRKIIEMKFIPVIFGGKHHNFTFFLCNIATSPSRLWLKRNVNKDLPGQSRNGVGQVAANLV